MMMQRQHLVDTPLLVKMQQLTELEDQEIHIEWDESGVKLLINDHQNISRKVKGQLRESTEERMIHKDARIAGTCLIMQNPYLRSVEFGRSIDAEENLMKEHEALEEEAVETDSSRKRKKEVRLVNEKPYI